MRDDNQDWEKRQALWDIYVASHQRNSRGKGYYSIAEKKLSWETTSATNPFTKWNTDPDGYTLDQLCMFEEDDSWRQKRSRLMAWLDQRSDVSSTTGAGPGTTPSPRW